MLAKPKHLGWEYAAQFQDRSVVEAYQYRPSYPAEVFGLLAGLIRDEPRVVLDAGCGRGEIARRLIEQVERVDAVDASPSMLERGRGLPGGDNPNLHWIEGRAEDAPLEPPYALITAGSSLHWMDWEIVLPRFREMLTPNGCLAIVVTSALRVPWQADLHQLIARYSTNRDYQPFHDLLEELERRTLFERRGDERTEPVRFVQPVGEYIESFHSRNGFSRQRMRPDMAAEFDTRLRELVSAHGAETVELQITSRVTWGRPARSASG